MSKIYQKNYLVKEVDAVLRETQKIQVLYDKWSVGNVAKRIKLLDNGLTEQQAEAIAK
jgi:cupin superfamily acireductone dioxygenase involved in methionine salvage